MAKKKNNNNRIKASKRDGKEMEKVDDDDVDDSAELTASPPPPPPPPPPAPPLPTSPTFKASPRVVRRQSTSAASPPASARADSGHARSATDPSSSTPDLARFSNQSTSKASTALPTLIAQAALKRSNTINSFAPRRSPSPSSSPTRWGGDGDDGVRTNGNNSARRTSSPPPAIKPKPASLTLSNTTAQKKMVAHERSASALLRAALVQGAAAAAAVQSGGSNFNPNSSSNAGGSGSKSGLATTGTGSGSGTGNGIPNGKKPSIDRPEPERRGSVAQLALSLESTLQFSAPPSPGTPPALFKRSSVASNKSLMSLKSVRSVRNANANGGELAERDEDAEEGGREGDEEAERDEREEGRERMSLPPPANFKAVVASLVAKGVKAYASSPAPTDSRPAKKSAAAAVSTAPAPSPPPTPPLSPPSTGRTETDMFTAPESPPFSPPPPTPPPHRATSASPPPPPRPSKASKPKFVVQRREAEGEKLEVVVPSSPAREERPVEDSASAAAAAALGENDDDDIAEAEKAQPPASAPDPVSVPASTSTKRLSVPPSRPPPPPPPPEEESEAGDEAGEEAAENKNGEEIPPTLNPKDAESSEGATPNEQEAPTPAPKPTPASPSPPPKSAKRYSIPPPPRPPPPPPVEVDEEIAEEAEEGGEGEGEGEETPVKLSKPQRPVPELPPPTPGPGLTQSEGDEEDGAVLGRIVVQEPDGIADELELAGIVDEHGQVQLRLEGGEREYDSAQDSSDDERYESYKSALSRNGSTSLPPTPPTKHDVSFPINHLTSKWSRNTSAVQSTNASASTLALVDQPQLHTHAEVEVYTDVEEDEEGDTTLAHANVHELTEPISPDNAKDIDISINKEAKTMAMPEGEDPMDSRFKFPPVESFPPPPPLFKRNATNDKNPSNRKGMAFANESETSLASVGGEREENESADDADRESTAPRNRKKSKTKIALRTAVLAALGKSTAPSGAVAEPIPEQHSSPTASHAEGDTETTTTHHSSDDESNPITWQMKARFAKLDVNEPSSNSNRPAPFPASGDGEHGQSQSAPEVPRVSRRPGAGVKGSPEDEVKKRQVRLSSKLLPITGPTRMNTSPSTTTITAWGKHKMVMSSETVGTIGTIATEPGDLEQSQSQYGGNSASGESRAQSPPPPPPLLLPPSSFFLHRMKSDASRHRRPPVRRQTTSTSQASRFVEDLPFFNKRSTSPTSMSRSPSQYQDQSPVHQRATTVSFSSRVRTGSMGTIMGAGTGPGPATRKNSLIPELRAATIEAAERPLSAVSGDFVLVEEPEEFDIPRAEWDLPRIPSGSLRFPSTMDLRTKMAQAAAAANGNREKLGPSSAYATAVPVSIAPVMQHSRSATTGTSGTSATSGTSSTAKSSASAPAAPIGATNATTTLTPANAIAFQVSSGSDMTGVGTGSRIGAGDSRGGRLSADALLDLWGRVGVYMSDAAALLHDKSRRMLVGDGTYPGFALAVARQVPTACIPSRSARYPYGHLIYFQTAGTVHKRCAEVLPGDVIVLQNALFKGVRGPLHQSYQEELGAKGDPVVGVIGEFEARKSKVRVYQANQHVGIQTVEYVSYRFEDLKSGTIKVRSLAIRCPPVAFFVLNFVIFNSSQIFRVPDS
ncbi:hypothetical protein ACEPAI_9495 [Sanghuangporus weigelae]